jgi:hypothetical protein
MPDPVDKPNRVELAHLRDSHSKWFVLPDGTRQAELSLKWPVHYLDADGSWQDIDTTLVPDAEDAEFDLSCRKHSFSAVRLAKRSPQPVRVERGGCRLTLRAQNVANVRGVASANRLVFADAWPDADLSWLVVPEGLRKVVTLKSPLAPSSYSFLLALDNLDLLANQDGSFYAWSGPLPVFELARPWVHDANGTPGPATLTLRTEGDKTFLDLLLDPAWLADPARAFPVLLDPTVIQPDAAAGKDTFADGFYPNSNRGTATTLQAGRGPAAFVSRSFLEFALAAYNGIILTAASLELWCSSELNTTDHAVAAHRVTAPWTEDTMTWNTGMPAYDATAEATVTITGPSASFAWNLLTLANQWLAGTYANYGVAMIGVEGSTDSEKTFRSSDWTTASERPKLTLTCAIPTVTPTSPTGTLGAPGTVTDDVSPLLAWTYGETSGNPQKTKQARVYTADGATLVVDSGEVTSATASYQCVANALDYGVKYRWQVRVSNGMEWSAYSGWQYFICSLSAPVGLVATPHTADAHTDLAWTAHTGEDLYGYKVYRRLHSAADSTYIQINYGSLTTDAYVDDTAQTGIAYAYAVTAIANDLYESAKSTHADGTVTYPDAWVGATVVLVRPSSLRWVHRRLGSDRTAIDGSAVVQDFGYGPKRLKIGFLYQTIDERDALLALFPPGTPRTYRDGKGYVCRGLVAVDADEEPLAVPGATAIGWIEFAISEVTV